MDKTHHPPNGRLDGRLKFNRSEQIVEMPTLSGIEQASSSSIEMPSASVDYVDGIASALVAGLVHSAWAGRSYIP